MERLRFDDLLHPRPAPGGIDVQTTLQHFAIVTYAVPLTRFAPLIPERFEVETIEIGGRALGLLSVVPFFDVDFTSAVFPAPSLRCGQTNYRVYVRDRETGERVVWFFGTVLDSWTVIVPRFLWRLPWHAGKIRFDHRIEGGRYTRYGMQTDSAWAPSRVVLQESPGAEHSFPGFPDTESALVYLTHPLTGYYYRRDGRLGTYRVWHDRLHMRPARCLEARFDLLDRLGVVPVAEQGEPYNVMIQAETAFTIYLPPRLMPSSAPARQTTPGRNRT